MVDLTFKEKMLLGVFKDIGDCTVNECIDYLWENSGNPTKIKLGWRFFTHINKLPVKLEKAGLIKFTGKYKQGKFKMEKVWKVSNS